MNITIDGHKHQILEFTQDHKSSLMGSYEPGNNIIDVYQPTPEKVREMMQKAEEEKKKQEG